jgi:protein tyrosine/serine phosphatase
MRVPPVFVRHAAVRHAAAFAFVALSLASLSAEGRPSTLSPASIRIDNFGKINDNYYRGAQPDKSDYVDLSNLGVKTVVDLQRDGRDDEEGLVQRTGMKFYRIPLTTSDRPSEGAIAQFLKIVNDPANQPVYVHCAGGRHRTGAMTAVYRMTQDGWTADRAYEEMKQFKFEGFPGHPTLKRFVFDFPTQLSKFHGAEKQPTLFTAAAQ